MPKMESLYESLTALSNLDSLKHEAEAIISNGRESLGIHVDLPKKQKILDEGLDAGSNLIALKWDLSRSSGGIRHDPFRNHGKKP